MYQAFTTCYYVHPHNYEIKTLIQGIIFLKFKWLPCERSGKSMTK